MLIPFQPRMTFSTDNVLRQDEDTGAEKQSEIFGDDLFALRGAACLDKNDTGVYPRPHNHFSSNLCRTSLAAQRPQHSKSVDAPGLIKLGGEEKIRVGSLAVDNVSVIQVSWAV